MLDIARSVAIPDDEVAFQAVRAQGPGGQHGDKAATAVQLRFSIRGSSLPEAWQERLLAASDHRITRDGEVVIKAQEHRSQDMNREAALARLRALIREHGEPPKRRRPTRPSRASQRRRMEEKKRHKHKKALRKNPRP